jgi:hypothetical protein
MCIIKANQPLVILVLNVLFVHSNTMYLEVIYEVDCSFNNLMLLFFEVI